MEHNNEACYIKGCLSPVSGYGVRIAKSMCERHIAQDRDKVKQLIKSMQDRLKPLTNRRNALKLHEQALAVELNNANDLIESAVNSLLQWKETLLSLLNNRHKCAMQKLNEFSALHEYETALAEADAKHDVKKSFELTSAMELKCGDLADRLELIPEISPASTRSVGDVSGSLRDLQFIINRRMYSVVQLCDAMDSDSDKTELQDLCDLTMNANVCNVVGNKATDRALQSEQESALYEVEEVVLANQDVCTFECKITDLQGFPNLVAACNNPDGFVGNRAGRVVKSLTSPAVQLPKPCLFVAFNPDPRINYLLACSIDGSVLLKTELNIKWSKRIVGLCCDSERQVLYIAQSAAVTVADLSGSISLVAKSSSFANRAQNSTVCGLTSSKDSLFLLVSSSVCRTIVSMHKDSGQVLSSMQLTFGRPDTHGTEFLSVVHSNLLLTDWANPKVHRICIASGHLISSYPTDESRFDCFQRPSGVAAHPCGLIFVSESSNCIVRILNNDGTVLQTIGVRAHQPANQLAHRLVNPCGLAIVDSKPQLLVVPEEGGKSISVFRLCQLEFN